MVNTVFSVCLYFVCIQISVLLAENESTTDNNIKVIQDTSKPSLMKSENIGINKKFEMDFYDNRVNLGNYFQDYSQFHTRTSNGVNNMFNSPNRVNYLNAENVDAYHYPNDQQANYLWGPNLYDPLKPGTGFSNDIFYRQYPNQGQEPNSNGDYNTGFYNQNGFIDHKRPQNGFLNSDRLDQNEFPNIGRLDQYGFTNMGRPDVRAGQPSQNGLFDQGQPASNNYFNRGQQSEYYLGQPNQNNILNEDSLERYPNDFLWDQQQPELNQNWLLNQDNNQDQYNNENGQLNGRNLQYGQESSIGQRMLYPSDYLINNFGPSKVPVPTFIQNDNSTPGDDNVVAILGQPVVLPETTMSSDKIIFPNSTESASRKQCAQDCLATSEYDPVCGTDKVTYINPGKLICARNCGISTYVLHNGVCDGDLTF